MKRLLFVCGAFALVALSLLACGESGTSPPPGGYSDAARPTVEALAIERLATAQAYESQAQQAELERQEADRQAQQRYIYLTAEAQQTAEAHRRAIEQQNQWATQQAANATQVAQATAQAVAVAATAQQQAIEATAQQRALEATATAEAWNRQGTATAQVMAWGATVTRAAWEGKTTATAEVIAATAAAYAATATRAAEKREVVLGYGRDYGIPLLLFALVICGAVLGIHLARQYAKRPIVYSRSLLGDAQPMAVPQKGGGYTFVDLDRQPGPALQIGPGGEVNAPLLRSAGQEERTTARDQAVDAVTRPKLGAGHKGGQTPAVAMAPPPAPTIRVLPPDQVRPWIEDVETQLLEEVNE